MDAFVSRSADAANEVLDGRVEALGELREDTDAGVTLPAFDTAYVGERKAGGDGDLLLGQPVLGTDPSDIGGEALDRSSRRHELDLSG